LWQMTHTKLPESKLHDWPLQGVCSTPVVEGNRLYYVSNRAQVVAIDSEGFRDGENDGPYKEEADTSEIDGDVVWVYDLMGELDVFPHNLAAGSPLVVGDLIFASTGTGVDEAHINVPTPYAPSLVAIDKNTGELVWDDATPDEKVLHGTWSNPSYAEIKGREQLLFPAGDGWVYSFEPKTGKILWKFDANPKDSLWRLGGAGTRNNIISMAVIYDDKAYVGVGQDPEHGEAPGHFYAIDTTLSGDVTDKAKVWSRDGEDFNRTISSASIKDDIVYIADLSGFLYALDAQTGEHYWTYDAFAAIWGSSFVADGKIYLGDEDGDIVVLKEGKGKDGEPEVLAEDQNMGAAVYTTAVAHEGTLFVLARNRLFALEEGAMMKKEKPVEAGE
ncbi:MAG: PQQ-binding-like beta-propeller repeat protein, partial [Acidobacteriota bacterium]|nr:PQQ-binding-like beta-propeller repeat protein [Acidobacteriota bacterium]